MEEIDLEGTRHVVGAVAELDVGFGPDGMLPHADPVAEFVEVYAANRLERAHQLGHDLAVTDGRPQIPVNLAMPHNRGG